MSDWGFSEDEREWQFEEKDIRKGDVMNEEQKAKVADFRGRTNLLTKDIPEPAAVVYTTITINGRDYNVTQRTNTNIFDALEILREGALLYNEIYGGVEKPKEPVQLQEHDENGLPVVDENHEPVLVSLPGNSQALRIKSVYHGKNQAGDKDLFKVIVDKEPREFGGKYGMVSFHPPACYKGWEKWIVDSKYAPKPEANVVIVEPGDPYPNILAFRSE